MKAISIREPWATAIAKFGKNLENRGWGIGYVGQIAIHATRPASYFDLGHDAWEVNKLSDGAIVPLNDPDAVSRVYEWSRELIPRMKDFRSAIVAVADVTGCIYPHQKIPIRFARWWFGPYALKLENVRALPSAVFTPGQLGIWEVSPEVALQVKAQLAGLDTSGPSLMELVERAAAASRGEGGAR